MRILLPILLAASAAAQVRVATFRADVTPALGEPLIWTTPAKVVADALLAKGLVIENGPERYVLCALDWCGLGNRAHRLFREKIAAAAATDVSRVALHVIHQHTAPYVDVPAHDAAGAAKFSDASLELLAGRVAKAAGEALKRLEPFDRVGVATARVERVASARRMVGVDGKPVTRWSSSGKDPQMAAAPEGDIDPFVRSVTLARGARPLVRLHYYATHPQTFCCEGTVSADFVGAAREALEREERVPQIYFTGAAGDVTVGKYNDGSVQARDGLTARMLDGLRRSARATQFAPVSPVDWLTSTVTLPRRKRTAEAAPESADGRYRLAINDVFMKRQEPLEIALLKLGDVRILHLPGEPMLEFQRYAQSSAGGKFVAFAGYGDVAPGYVCTDAAYSEGGYEPSVSNTGPGAEAAIKAAIRLLLAERRK